MYANFLVGSVQYSNWLITKCYGDTGQRIADLERFDTRSDFETLCLHLKSLLSFIHSNKEVGTQYLFDSNEKWR